MAKKKKTTAKKKQAQNKCSRKDCVYHPPQCRGGTCDYIVIEGKSRHCPIENCDKYKKR